MRWFTKFLIFCSVLVLSFSIVNIARATCPNSCTQNGDCNPCCNNASGNQLPACTNHCNNPYGGVDAGTCNFTQDDPGQGGYQCVNWCGWSACVNGSQSNQCCGQPSDELQVRSCSTSGGGGGGGATPPPECSATNPATPTLSSLSDGASLSNLAVTLIWNAPTSWGTGCPQDNYYNVYLGTTTIGRP